MRAELERQYPDGYLHVVSLQDPRGNGRAGTMSEVSAENAARVLQDGTHAVCTAAQVHAYQEAQARRREHAAITDGVSRQ
jgi:hypothetical protein